ncbi:MAG: PAS domain S-box protein [Chloroflexi bacterium]|nr:PAS domain S-box protein [Chloroflexota bacterium]
MTEDNNNDAPTLSVNRAIFARSHDPLFIIAAETGYHQEFNPAAASLLGYSPDELRQKTVTDIVSPDSRVSVQYCLDTLPAKMTEPLQIHLLTNKGHEVPVEWSVVPFRHAGRPALLVHVRDIRKRLQTEDELRWMIHKVEILKQVHAMISARGGLQANLRDLLDFVCDTMQLESGSIYLAELGNGDVLRLAVQRGLVTSLVEGISAIPLALTKKIFSRECPVVRELSEGPIGPFLKLVHVEGFSYVASIPILSHDGPIGMLALATKGSHRLDDRDLFLLERIGNETGEAIIHQQLHEQTRRQLELMRAFQTISHQISLSRDPQETFKLVGKETMRAMKADRFGLYLVNPLTDRVEHTWSVGLGQEYIETIARLYEQIPGSKVISYREPRLILDALQDPSMAPLYDVVKQENYRSLGLFPMVSQNQTIGTIGYYYDTIHPFSQEEIEIAQTFADELATFVQNFRLLERLQQAESWRRLTLEATHEAVVTADEASVIVDVNPAACEIFGYTADEFLGRAVTTLMREVDQEQHSAGYARFLQAGQKGRDIPIRGTGKRKDGSTFPLEISVGGFTTGDHQFVTAFIRDHSEVQQLEGRLRQAQKMEAVGTLAGGVAHDFNNILTGVIGYVELSMMKLPLSHPVRENLQKVKALGERAATLTRQLLAFSRQQVLAVRPLDLNVVVTELTSFLERVISEDVALRVLPGQNLWTVQADRSALEQVLMNLCVNARDAMPEGGELLIETANIVLDEEYRRAHPWARPGRYVMIEVSDTGVGMDKETIEHIFEPFFTTKEVGKGTGLGLAMVYGLVKQHEGLIHVYSEMGEGTTFKIYLPALSEKTPPDTHQQTREPELPAGRGTILVVEDEEALRELISQALSQQGYRVLLAANGQEALNVWAEYGDVTDAIIADVVMPKMGGRELYDHLQHLSPQTRFLFISGYSINGIHQRFLLDQGLEFLQKPFTPAQLLERVQAILVDASSQ